jgi:site-specific recombinase XerD
VRRQKETVVKISEAFEAYARDVIVFRNQSSSTEENHYVCMKALLVHFGDMEIEKLEFSLIRDWKLALARTRSPETVRNYIVRLRVVLQYLVDHGVNVVNPKQVPVPNRGDKVPDICTEQEVALLIETVSKPCSGYALNNRYRNAAVIAVLYASGIRVSELCKMNRSDIRSDGTFTVVGKGNKARLCFLDERAVTLINKYLEYRDDNSSALFLSKQNHQRITPGGVQFVFRLARQKAGLKTPIHAHTLRHAFATNLLRNDANIRYVQEMLGHASLETTQMYTHVINRDLHRIYTKHHTI